MTTGKTIALTRQTFVGKVMSLLFNMLSSVQSLSHVRLFATPWIAARQASLSITNSRSSLRLMSIESVMPSSHLILSSPFPPAPNPSQHQSLFQWVNSSHEVAKVHSNKKIFKAKTNKQKKSNALQKPELTQLSYGCDRLCRLFYRQPSPY